MMPRIGQLASVSAPNHGRIVDRNCFTSEVLARRRPAVCKLNTGAIAASSGGNGSTPDLPPSSMEKLQDELDRANVIIQQLQSEVERLRLASLEARALPTQHAPTIETSPHAATQTEGSAPSKGKQPLDKLKVLSLGLMYFCSCASCEPCRGTLRFSTFKCCLFDLTDPCLESGTSQQTLCFRT